ncbi:hypothetical protein KPSA3_07645 [Pseudomonas syringae pv. actinidiae]|uniref:Uncharacterized protein n=1 Tax=Pseudomonas syringae pv. actinidiae TaxID=103796 RepID=A0AAN4QDD6_PSESF|nr:hypothetical protein KPSA3_07645 [Pseudomonas syringae pv. actinidiae]
MRQRVKSIRKRAQKLTFRHSVLTEVWQSRKSLPGDLYLI